MRITTISRRLQQFMLVMMGVYGFDVLVYCFYTPEMLSYRWLIPCFHLLLMVVSLVLPPKWRMPMGAVGAVAVLVWTVTVLQGDYWVAIVVAAIVQAVVLMWSMRIASWAPEMELPGAFLAVFLVGLLANNFVATYSVKFETIKTELRLIMFAYTALTLLSLNRDSWTLACAGKQRFSPSMRGKNILLTLGFFAIGLAAALVPSMAKFLGQLVNLILRFIDWLTALFESSEQVTETTEAIIEGTDEGIWGTTPVKDDNMLVVIQIGAIIIMVLLGAFVLWKLFKYLWKLAKRLAGVIADAFVVENAEFQDEITDIREDRERSEGQKSRRVRRPPVSMKKMSPAEKIRYRYLRLLDKNPQWGKHTTARENLVDSAARIYEQVRYSDHPVTEAEAEQFQTETTTK